MAKTKSLDSDQVKAYLEAIGGIYNASMQLSMLSKKELMVLANVLDILPNKDQQSVKLKNVRNALPED